MLKRKRLSVFGWSILHQSMMCYFVLTMYESDTLFEYFRLTSNTMVDTVPLLYIL